MASCLGIYFDDNIVKYAKLSIENSGNISVEKYGMKFTSNDPKLVIDEIIEETQSQDIPIVINPKDDVYYNTQIYEQVQNKSYIPDIVKLEYESWCEKNAKAPDRYFHTYLVSEAKNSDNKRNTIINIALKEDINKQLELSKNIVGICPAKPILRRLVSNDQGSYILVNLDKEMSVTVVIDGKIVEFRSYTTGMKPILEEFTSTLGSYQKAYNTCKQMNVYTEGESSNDPTLEQIVEPVFQEMLKQCLSVVNNYKGQISTALLAGIGTAFTNVDLLFSQFLEIKCSVLKPFFIKDTSDVRYMSEILEVTEAIALAFEFLNPRYPELEYVTKKMKLGKKMNSSFSFKDLFKPKAPKFNQNVPTGGTVASNANNMQNNLSNQSGVNSVSNNNVNTNTRKNDDTLKDKGTPGGLPMILVCASIVAIIVLISYITFSVIYSSVANNMITSMDQKKQNINTETEKVNNDITYVDKNMKAYKDVNDQVESIKSKIESNQIGKFTTYNVASLLQNIIKVIPSNVQLVNISSDDNKYVKITASSTSYQNLGFFFAQIKLENVLNNPKIITVNNGETTTVEIGGDIP